MLAASSLAVAKRASSTIHATAKPRAALILIIRLPQEHGEVALFCISPSMRVSSRAWLSPAESRDFYAGRLWGQWASLEFWVMGAEISMGPSIVFKGLAAGAACPGNPGSGIQRHIPKTQLAQSSSNFCSDDYPA